MGHEAAAMGDVLTRGGGLPEAPRTFLISKAVRYAGPAVVRHSQMLEVAEDGSSIEPPPTQWP